MKHYVLIRLTIFFWREKSLSKLPHASQMREKHTYWVIDWYWGACFKMLVFTSFQISIYMHAACCKPEIIPICCWRGVCVFIDLSFENKVCLFIKHEPCHLKIPHRKSSPWGQPTSTSVKLNAVTTASNCSPLLIAIKGLFVSMLVLTKLISFSECWSADLLVFLSVLEQESSRHRSAQRKVKWCFFVTTNLWHRTDNQEDC